MSDPVRPLILFDIDYTIFNTDKYRRILYPRLAQELGLDEKQLRSFRQEFEPEMKKKFGHFNPEFFLQKISTVANNPVTIKKLEEIFWDKAMYSSALDLTIRDVLEDLSSQNIAIGILSTGDSKHQLAKVETLLTYFPSQHHHIFSNKINSLKNVLESYSEFKLYVVDDLPEVLAKAKELDPRVLTILKKTEKIFETTKHIENFSPDFTIDSLKQIKQIVL